MVNAFRGAGWQTKESLSMIIVVTSLAANRRTNAEITFSFMSGLTLINDHSRVLCGLYHFYFICRPTLIDGCP
jgi:hypothetical protein